MFAEVISPCCSDLLLSKSDGIEVSYNACGVIANLMSDGPAAWTATKPSRYKVLDRNVLAVCSWPLSQKRNINYRSALKFAFFVVFRCVFLAVTRVMRQFLWPPAS